MVSASMTVAGSNLIVESILLTAKDDVKGCRVAYSIRPSLSRIWDICAISREAGFDHLAFVGGWGISLLYMN